MADSPGDLTPDSPGADDDDAQPVFGGMSWSWDSDTDFEALMEAVNGAAPWLRDTEAADDPQATDVDPEADEAAYQEALAAGRVSEMPLSVVAGRIAESLPTGPGLAGWLAQAPAPEMEDGALAGVASSFRRLASWAAAGELAAVAQIASRSARTDRRASVDPSGRPDRVTADASGQVSLALAMSPDGASGWTDLAVTLTWRLSATGAALAAGEIDLSRARMIARVTGPLSDEAARQVEAAVLGRAGWLTLGQLYAALRRAVLKADPEGAERRRREAERNAKVVLYPEDEGTATLAGYSLPGVQAAAAMARITALAKAMQATGAAGQIDLVRAQVFLGLLLGTLPYIPPAPGAPPDDPPPDDSPRDDSPAHDPPLDDPPPDDSFPDDSFPDDPRPDDSPPDGPPHGGAQESSLPDDLPNPPDTPDGPPSGPGWPWPAVPPYLPAGPGTLAGLRPATGPGGRGLLNLTVPLATLTGASAAPGQLSRLGIITTEQSRQLAALAARHPAARWRIIVTTPGGEAIAVTYLARSRSPDGPGAASIGLIGRVTLIVRVDQLGHGPPDEQRHGPAPPGSAPPPPGPAPPGPAPPDPAQPRHPPPPPGSPLAKIVDRALAAARREAAAAEQRRENDERAGGCAHELASAAYRPPPRIAELVTARDQTCRYPPCRRPAEQCDLDHRVPYDQGGLTCPCNIDGKCRSHHQLKQHPRWSVTQSAPGVSEWTTPAGRSYFSRPDPYLT